MNTQPNTQNVHHLFERQAERAPYALAVSCSRGQLTYGELNARADQLARRLRALGVGPEILVGLCVPRSPAMLVGALGILKAGGAYLPLDPSEPQSRLNFMFSDAGVSVVVTEGALREKMAGDNRVVIAIDEPGVLSADNRANSDAPEPAASETATQNPIHAEQRAPGRRTSR